MPHPVGCIHVSGLSAQHWWLLAMMKSAGRIAGHVIAHDRCRAAWAFPIARLAGLSSRITRPGMLARTAANFCRFYPTQWRMVEQGNPGQCPGARRDRTVHGPAGGRLLMMLAWERMRIGLMALLLPVGMLLAASGCARPLADDFKVVSTETVNWREQDHAPGPNAASFVGSMPDRVLDRPGHRILGDNKSDQLVLKVSFMTSIDLQDFIERREIPKLFRSADFCSREHAVLRLGPVQVYDKYGMIRRFRDNVTSNTSSGNSAYYFYIFFARKIQNADGKEEIIDRVIDNGDDVCVVIQTTFGRAGYRSNIMRILFSSILSSYRSGRQDLPIY